MRTIVWWTVWGLAAAAGLVALWESPRNHFYLLFSIPVLTGAAAAAVARIEYEYHHAIQHAKWLGLSSCFLISGLGFLYIRANALGPFATGTTHKALLGTTFGMSEPEVERALGRRLSDRPTPEPVLQERAQEWLLQALPLSLAPHESQRSTPLTLYGVPCQATFLFPKGRLGRVELACGPRPITESVELMRRIRRELEKDYTRVRESIYRKEAVEAVLENQLVGPRRRVRVTLQYLPFADATPPPLIIEADVF